MSKQSLSNAEELYWGRGRYAALLGVNGRVGSRMDPIVKLDLGAPLLRDNDALILAATGAELPNTETVTYTFPGSASPVDGIRSDGIFDVPRNIRAVISHASSIVAMTIIITGKDEYDETMSELITVVATGTDTTYNGKKAFKSITSIAITSAADAETNTANIGFGDVLGLPLNLEGEFDILGFYAGNTEEKLAAVFVAADTDVATTSTGDIRGTVDPDTVLDGSVNFICWMKPKGVNTKIELVGVSQA